MPIAVRRGSDPFNSGGRAPDLKTPQARLLAPLVPADPSDPPTEWPCLTRANLGVQAGYTAISGTVTRALNGLAARRVVGARPRSGSWKQVGEEGGVAVWEGSTGGEPHLGLLALGYVEEMVYDIDGVREVNYRATAAGVAAYRAHVARSGGTLPGLRERESCINNRYRGDGGVGDDDEK